MGIQTNPRSAPEVTLRMRPRGPIAFATELRVRFRLELLGQPISADLESRGVRRVLERRADGALAIEEIDTQRSFTFSMAGESGGTPGELGAPESRRYFIDERGARLPDPPVAEAAPEIADALERALEPLVRALEFPAEPVAIGEQWGGSGAIALGDIEPSIEGGARYELTQRLERFEGSGDDRMAVISFEGSLEGSGRDRGAEPGLDSGPIRGWLRVRGFYAVALADGFARIARAEIDGSAELGDASHMTLPIRGAVEWLASPVDAALPLATTVQ